ARRARADADDPARRPLARGVRPWRPARAREAPRAPGPPHDRPRQAPVTAREPLRPESYNPGMLGEVLTAIVTPFDADGAVDYERFRELATYLVEHGSDGLVVGGTTGEAPTRSADEPLELARRAVDALGDRRTPGCRSGSLPP